MTARPPPVTDVAENPAPTGMPRTNPERKIGCAQRQQLRLASSVLWRSASASSPRISRR